MSASFLSIYRIGLLVVCFIGIWWALRHWRRHRLPALLLLASMLLEIGLRFGSVMAARAFLRLLPYEILNLLLSCIYSMPYLLLLCAVFAGRRYPPPDRDSPAP